LEKAQVFEPGRHGHQKIIPHTSTKLTKSYVLKFSKNDIGNFLKNADGDFLGSCGSCPRLGDIHFYNCNITAIPATIFSQSFNLQHLDLSNNYLRTVDLDLRY